MTTITSLNQTSPSELKKIIEDNGISIKGTTNKSYKVICPNCDKPEAYIYFNQGTRTIHCNRENNCNFNEDLWDYIANKRGFSTKDMTRYINQILGYEFKDLKGETDIYTPINDKPKLITTPSVTKPLKTIEETEEEQSFFNCCHKIFIDSLNDQDNEYAIFSLKYLKEERGYNDEQIRSFKLGFFPDKDKFISLLTNSGYSENKAQDLINEYFTAILKINNYQKEEERKNRIAFTWFDTDRNIIGFSVRKPTTKNELKPKYLNNNGLSKTEYLFNFTKDIADKELVIVEGQLDALVGTYFASQQEETSNYHFVAMGGSSISESQVNYLKKHSYSKVILLPDNDKNAGEKGAKESIEKLLAQSITPYVASIPDGYPCKDIDELIKTCEDEIDLKAILEKAVKQKIPTNTNNTPKEEPKMTAQKNDDKPLDPEIQELLNQINEDRKVSISTKEPLDILNYNKQIHDLKTELTGKNIGLNKKFNPNFIALNNIYSDIREYNKLLSSDDTETKPYTYKQFILDIENSTDGLKTGFWELDQHVSIQPSSLVFVAGRPSHGKTTMMLNMLKNMILANEDKAFLFYSYEETRSDILLKLILNITDDDNLNVQLQEEEKHEKKKGANLRQRALNQFKRYALCVREDAKGKMFTLNSTLDAARKKVEEWVDNERLQIMTPKSSTESLSAAIIERCISCSKSKNTKPIAAIFIDYVQKLSTEEERVNRQQEIQRICQTLLTTTLDKRVAIPIILGAQVNREVKSLDTFNLSNMREAGDIEQDANLIIGIWNEQAGNLDNLLVRQKSIARKIELYAEGIGVSKYSKEDLEKRLANVEKAIESLKNPQPNTPVNLQIKVLKNRNGQNNGVFELNGYLNRYLIEDNLSTLEKKHKQNKQSKEKQHGTD